MPLPEAPPSYDQVVKAARGWQTTPVDDALPGPKLVETARKEKRDAVLVASGGETWFASGAESKRETEPVRHGLR